MGFLSLLTGLGPFLKGLINKWTVSLLAVIIIVLLGYKGVDKFSDYMETTISTAVRDSEEKLITEINKERYSEEFEKLQAQIALNLTIIERQNIAISEFMNIRDDIDDGLTDINKKLNDRTEQRVDEIGDEGRPSILSPYLTDLFDVIGDAEKELVDGDDNEAE